MSEPIVFSIIIPTFNRSAFIGKAIQSALNQQYREYEIIVVDDGSTDNTESIVSSFHDSRVKYFKKVNGERAAARNFGIHKSSGHYITFLDSDDLLKENHLSTAFEFLNTSTETSVFHLGYDVVRTDGTMMYPWRPLPDPANEKLLEGNFLSCLGVFIRRQILISIRFNEDLLLTGSEDYELWIRLAARYPIRANGNSTALLVNHGDRSVLSVDPEKFRRRIDLVKFYLSQDAMVNECFGGRLNILYSFLELYAALHFAISDNKKLGLIAWWSAWMGYLPMVWNYRFWVVLKKLVG